MNKPVATKLPPYKPVAWSLIEVALIGAARPSLASHLREIGHWD